MTFHKEGSTSLALSILLIFLLNAIIQFYMPQAHAFKWIVYIFSFALFVSVLLFFRKPSVTATIADKFVTSPADGNITAIEEVTEPAYLKGKSMRVSIHLSPLNARLNRNPISGEVKHFSHTPKGNGEREHTSIAIEHANGSTVLVQQSSGAFIQNLVADVKQGNTVTQGEPFGFVKFGNRVDVFLPPGSQVKVEQGEAVQAGVTVLAQFKS